MIATWITESEETLFSTVEDKELNELFQEVRAKYGNRFLIQTTEFDNRTLWDRITGNYKRTGKCYTVYNNHKFPDAQIINFPPLEGNWSINTSVPKALVMAYFYGLLTEVPVNPSTKGL